MPSLYLAPPPSRVLLTPRVFEQRLQMYQVVASTASHDLSLSTVGFNSNGETNFSLPRIYLSLSRRIYYYPVLTHGVPSYLSWLLSLFLSLSLFVALLVSFQPYRIMNFISLYNIRSLAENLIPGRNRCLVSLLSSIFHPPFSIFQRDFPPFYIHFTRALG